MDISKSAQGIDLGILWLATKNPDIDWATGKVTMQKKKTFVNLLLICDELEESMDVNQ